MKNEIDWLLNHAKIIRRRREDEEARKHSMNKTDTGLTQLRLDGRESHFRGDQVLKALLEILRNTYIEPQEEDRRMGCQQNKKQHKILERETQCDYIYSKAAEVTTR